jgi:ABC-type Fe3+/spermidine/putrescine transport system ATPase subunit
MVFQKYALFPHLTVAQNIAFPLVQRQVPRKRIHSEIAAVVDLVGLSGLEHRPSTDLSGGQQQRVALARALVYRPAVLLMDEPFGALDRKLRERLQVELKDIQRLTGTTVLFVTHDQTEALTMADRVAVVNHGRIEQIGAPEDLYERPVSSFVADFIGEANIFSGIVIGADDAVCRMQLGDGSIVCGMIAGGSGRPAAGTRAEIVLRPAKIRLLADPTAAPASGKVSGVGYAGETISVRLDMDAGPRLMVRSTSLRERPAIGQRLGVDWQAADARVFPSRVQ